MLLTWACQLELQTARNGSAVGEILMVECIVPIRRLAIARFWQQKLIALCVSNRGQFTDPGDKPMIATKYTAIVTTSGMPALRV